MTRQTIKFENNMNYKIVCKDVNVKDVYVGRTTNFVSRRAQHKKSSNSEGKVCSDRTLYKTIRENGGFDNWEMILIENYPCENNIEADKRERYWVEQFNANLNSVVPASESYASIKMKQMRDRRKLENKEEYQRNANEYQAQYRKNFEEIRKNKPDYSSDRSYAEMVAERYKV